MVRRGETLVDSYSAVLAGDEEAILGGLEVGAGGGDDEGSSGESGKGDTVDAEREGLGVCSDTGNRTESLCTATNSSVKGLAL